MSAILPIPEPVSWLHLGLLARLLLATILGGAIGFEREYSGKPAGLRTNILICVGAALLTELSLAFTAFTAAGPVRAAPARIAAQIVTGIGFIGAGTILQSRGSVHGLTTAATLWVVAAIGIAIGIHGYVDAVGTTVLVLVVLVLLGRLEDHLGKKRRRRGVEVVLTGGPRTVDELIAFMESSGLRVTLQSMLEDAASGTWTATVVARGPEDLFREVRTRLLERPDVRGFSQS